MSVDDHIKALYYSRQSIRITEKLNRASVGIAGAGGLGSVVAENLVRAGVGKLIIADMDVIEPSNLNRQRYLFSQVGQIKVEALADNLRRLNPFTEIKPIHDRLTAENCTTIFKECAAVTECFDDPQSKAELVNRLRMDLPECFIVAVSGVAGIGDANAITTRKISGCFFMVGDMQSESEEKNPGLYASRVGIAASMQAHIIIRYLAGEPL